MNPVHNSVALTSTMLYGKRAIVTGAATGIGRSVAHRFAREGADVALVDVDDTALVGVANEIASQGGRVLALMANVSSENDVAAAVDRVVQEWGGLDVAVANAGVQLAGQDDRVDQLSLEVWERTLAINLTGVFLTAKHAIRSMLESGGGSLVCTCSPTSLYGLAPGYAAYSASKAGVYGLVKVMAADYSKLGIRVNGVIPGYTKTSMTSWVTPQESEQLLRGIPMGRPGDADEVAAVMAFLASDLSPYVTGAVWAADGGMTAV